VAFVSSRLLLFVVSYVCLELFPPQLVAAWQAPAFPGLNWIDGWVRWDSMWYESIVDAHSHHVPKDLSNANFFPFYSWLSWVLGLPLRPFLTAPSAFFIAGLALSNVAFLVGLIGAYRLTSAMTGERTASWTVWLIALFPFSFFFSAVYAEALYFCLVVWCFYFARARRWLLACALAAIAAMTRIPGLVLIPALAIDYVLSERARTRWQAREIAAGGALLAAALAILAVYFSTRYGSPIAFVHARQADWHRATGFGAIAGDFRYFTEGSLLACSGVADCLRAWLPTRKLAGAWYMSLIPGCVALTLSAARTLGVGLVVWTLGSIAMALVNGLEAMGRFSAVLFPAFIGLALWLKRREAVVAVGAAFVPFLLFFTAQFARWRSIL
jgi:hypothetical protein